MKFDQLPGSMRRPRRFGRRRWLAAIAVIASLTVLAPTSSATATAQPASERAASAPNRSVSGVGVGPLAWEPSITPIYYGPKYGEDKIQNRTRAQRDHYLSNCEEGYACISAGEGNGLYTVFKLFSCVRRDTLAFVNAGNIANNQDGSHPAVLLYDKNLHLIAKFGVQPGIIQAIPDTIMYKTWYVDIC
ncbi:hypothetical protein OH802_15815 [Nocardioides sp. NBC_00850]|uniref:hypothetical protein n=1 Tax=Nocardioides sp. NBC_00850 TaxID=2976001 RepID=UPI00386A96D9|nr:hypothetical protein OH802_15815 [Nocardioides sp. NBC_00850]